MWNLKRNDTNELTKQKQTHKLRNELKVAEGTLRLMEGRDSQGVWDGHVHTVILKIETDKDLLYSTGNSAQCYVADWMGGEFWGRMDTCICMAQSLCCSPETIALLIGYKS